jgi:hypothetical protein
LSEHSDCIERVQPLMMTTTSSVVVTMSSGAMKKAGTGAATRLSSVTCAA